MKNILYPILIAIAAITVASCSVKEDMGDCIDPWVEIPDTMFVYLAFECIEIYDTDREILFDKVVDELELLFYNPDGKLAYDLRYTPQQLEECNWEVWLHSELVEPGSYTLLALVNYDNAHYTLTGKETLLSLLAGLEYDTTITGANGHNEISFPLTDTYYGYYELELVYQPHTTEHKIMLSKNTNLFNVTVLLREQSDYYSVISVESRITGNNTLYDWENRAIAAPQVIYPPYKSKKKDEERSYTDSLKTMRVWHASDLQLEVDVTTTQQVHNITYHIPQWLADIEKYDSDDKLEHYDEFDIKITLDGEFLILSVQVNGWYVVQNGQDI